jgi:hypothetical protein
MRSPGYDRPLLAGAFGRGEGQEAPAGERREARPDDHPEVLDCLSSRFDPEVTGSIPYARFSRRGPKMASSFSSPISIGAGGSAEGGQWARSEPLYPFAHF